MDQFTALQHHFQVHDAVFSILLEKVNKVQNLSVACSSGIDNSSIFTVVHSTGNIQLAFLSMGHSSGEPILLYFPQHDPVVTIIGPSYRYRSL